MPTWEEVSRCPRCGEPGRATSKTLITDMSARGFGGHVHTFICENERCKWFETGWIVQTMRDGSIIERKEGPKQFEALKNDGPVEQMARYYAEKAGFTIKNGQVVEMTEREKDEAYGPGWREGTREL